MRLRTHTQRRTTWIAVLAILMMAFAPLLSQAFGANSSSAWAEVCSVYGTKWVKVDPGTTDPQPSPASGHPLDHCPYCSLHASTLGMPPAPLVSLPPAVQHAVPQAFLAAPRTLHAWRTAQARAPPFLG